MPEFWRRRSLRFWLSIGMIAAVLPLAVSALTNHTLTHRHIVRPLVVLTEKHKLTLRPLQTIQIDLRQIANLIARFAANDDRREVLDAYPPVLEDIGTAFARLKSAVDHGMDPSGAIRQADARWREFVPGLVDFFGRDLPAQEPPAVHDIETMDAKIRGIAASLESLSADVAAENERERHAILSDLAWSNGLFEIAFGISCVFIVLGVVVINRSLVTSMEELADAALRLAAGDRDHRVEVLIPAELANVASAFNQMTATIVEQEDALEQAARVDALTGLLNRREFDRLLEEELARAERLGQPVSLVMIDIDFFKKFNDTYGHQGGDAGLRAIAAILTQTIRSIDRACRFGGEELTLILPACDAVAAGEIAERVRDAVEKLEIRLDGNLTARTTVSLGVATFPEYGRKATEIVRAADKALYVSKSCGRNRVSIAAELPVFG